MILRAAVLIKSADSYSAVWLRRIGTPADGPIVVVASVRLRCSHGPAARAFRSSRLDRDEHPLVVADEPGSGF
jgi:hypothetical protein